MKLDTGSFLFAASMSLLPVVSAWGFTVYDASTDNCSPSDSGNYVYYSGSDKSSCFEVGAPSLKPGETCAFYTGGGTSMGVCTAPMNPVGKSMWTDDGSSCLVKSSGAGQGNTDFDTGGCSPDGNPEQTYTGPMCDSALPGIFSGQSLYVQCQDLSTSKKEKRFVG